MVDSGLAVLQKEGFRRLLGHRVAILANQASIDADFRHVVDLALMNGVKISKLFAPEHGFNGILQDMEQFKGSIHPKYQVPIISLYGDHKESLRLNAEHLKDVDILLCDLQDIGSRYYTFHCTIAWAMAACAQSGTKLMVIDRPNPINAVDFEGNLVKKTHFSFVGAYPLLNRHGFSMGELTHYVADLLAPSLDLEVIEMKNYRRSAYFDETGLPFVPPSPNMPTLNTALVYPGMCLIEGTNLSEGRGTCTPFEMIGASYINDAERFKASIEDKGFSNGIIMRSVSFRPMFHKHAHKECGGIFVHVKDRKAFKPLRFALSVIASAMEFDGFKWRQEAYEYEHDRLAIDLLLGDQNLRLSLEQRAPLKEIFSQFEAEENAFKVKREQYLRY